MRDGTSQSPSRPRCRRVIRLRPPRPPCGPAHSAGPQWLYTERSSATSDYAPLLRSPWRAAKDFSACFSKFFLCASASLRQIIIFNQAFLKENLNKSIHGLFRGRELFLAGLGDLDLAGIEINLLLGRQLAIQRPAGGLQTQEINDLGR